MRKARKLASLKQYVVGRGSEATFADALEKQEAIIRYLGGCDPTGEVGHLSAVSLLAMSAVQFCA